MEVTMIVKKGDKWQVQSQEGKNLGMYSSKKEAKKRLRQVEYFKHLPEIKKKSGKK
jgi:hypothetical protein